MPGPGADPLSGLPADGPGTTGATSHRAQVLGPLRWVDLEPATAYAIARLRVDVFVVEQACPYPELDGRDLEPTAEHRWVAGAATGPASTTSDSTPDGAAGAGAVLAYLRVLDGGGERRVGRVVTAPSARGRGLAAALVGAVVADHGSGDLVLDAQSHLAPWYARFGFAVDGPGFVEDGIPHVPMRRPADPTR